jgi:hypothetical protein
MEREPGRARDTGPLIAVLPLMLFGLVLAWWGWKSGGYFEVTFLPGTMLLLSVLALLLLFVPLPGPLRGPTLVAFLALVGLAAWTLISGLWSTVPDIPWSDAQRAVGYAAAFAIGVWASLLLGRRMLLALGPLAFAGALVALLTLIVLWTGTNSLEFLDDEATLRYPIGYRNAEAAFFLMALMPTIVLAASRELDWRLRGVLLGSATLMIQLSVLAQSRASIFAIVIALAILVAIHPERLRVLGWLGMATAISLIALPWLLDVFQRDAGNTAAEIPPIHHACVAMALTSALSVAIGLAAARLGGGFKLPDRARSGIGWGLAACVALVVLAGFVALLRTDGGPGGFVSRHFKELTEGSPNLSTQSSRFGLDVRTDRGDFWRVAIDDFGRRPLGGDGAGGFRISYLEHRHTQVEPEDPHNVEMLMISELGLPGALLFLAFVIGSVVAVIRASRAGPSAAALAAGALALSGYWLAHASADWFWSYAAITLPVPFALGAAAAPALRREGETGRTAARTALAVTALAVALTMVPFFLSARYTNQGIRIGQSDTEAAYVDLNRAADLNPWTARPLAAESAIALQAGDDARGLSSIADAIDRSPHDWLLYMQKARVLAQSDPAGSRLALDEARKLNPGGPEIDKLAKNLGVTP